jgi:hypothetical protein
LWTRGLVRLPNHPRLLKELRLLERQTHRGGRDSVDHPRDQHDDFANRVCGVLHVLLSYLGFSIERMCNDEDETSTSERHQREADNWQRWRLHAYLRSQGIRV